MPRKNLAKRPAPPARQSSLLEIFNFEQGSPEWWEARRGLLTASNFSVAMAESKDEDASKTRTKLLHKLAGEIITEKVAEEDFETVAMRRGKEMEAEALADYQSQRGVEVVRIGLARNFSGLRSCGASPDGLVGFSGGVETKTAKPTVMIPLLIKGSMLPPVHRAQVHGNMHVLERDWWDLKIYYPKMPRFCVRVERDPVYIRQIDEQIQTFNFDLKTLVERLRGMGAG